jgi:type VI secretion system protein ImpM
VNGVSSETTGMQLPEHNFGWYGKLPSAGDFVSRRMPYALQQFWDRWCAAGVEALKERNPVSGWSQWGAMPKWAFILPTQPGVPIAQFGILAPSCDRVGRNYPLLITTPLLDANALSLLPRAAAIALAWGQVIAEAQAARAPVDVVDAQLAQVFVDELAKDILLQEGDKTLPPGVNPTTLPWPSLSESFDMRAGESYWWSVPPAGTGFRARTHTGPLNAIHFFNISA